MARCGCSDTCSCLIVQGDGIIVDGNGTVQNPYRVTADPDNVSEDVVFNDSGTIAWHVNGVGSGDQAMVISADAQVSMRELTDVLASDVPVTGDVVTWQTDHWEFMPTPAGTPLKGGTTGQVLSKKSGTDYDFQWATPPTPVTVQDTPTLDLTLTAGMVLSGVPTLKMADLTDVVDAPAPTSGQVPTWNGTAYAPATPSAGGGNMPAGGTTGQVLAKKSNTDYDTQWTAAGGTAPDEVVLSSTQPVITANTPELWLDLSSTGVTDDTGWVNLTPTSGTGTFRYRVIGKIIYVQASLSGVSSVAAGGTLALTAAGALPAAYRPAVGTYGPGNGGGSTAQLGVSNTDGSISFWNQGAGAVTVARFSLMYPMEN